MTETLVVVVVLFLSFLIAVIAIIHEEQATVAISKLGGALVKALSTFIH